MVRFFPWYLLYIVQEPEDLLNNWAGNISRLLDLVEKSCQQVSKECMIHKVKV